MARARLGVVTLSGGVGVLLADVAERLDLPMPALPDDAQRAILELVPFGAARNPIDPTAQVNVAPDLMEKTLDIAMAAGDFDALIVFVSGVPYSADLGAIYLDALRKIRARYRNRLVIVSALAPPAYRRRVERAGMLYFEDPTRACVALAALRSVARGWATRRAPVEVERATTPPWNGLRLDELEAKRILAAAGIPIARERLVDSVESAVTAAQAVGFPIALKIVSPDIAHKTEVGGVRLNLTDDQSVAAAYREIVASVATKASGAQIRGVAVAHMERGIETILGVTRDPTFGPVIMFGLGGIFVETLRDVTFRVAPFDRAEALTMIGEIKGYAILTGTRGHPPADIDALADALVKLAQFAAAHADSISSIDINPFIVRAKGQGAVALDALIVSTPSPRIGDTARSA
ncbi:MAG: acetate--CoA ligase family protein, partial [Burkholderiales bacterium]